jgi:hypothetical protein
MAANKEANKNQRRSQPLLFPNQKLGAFMVPTNNGKQERNSQRVFIVT